MHKNPAELLEWYRDEIAGESFFSALAHGTVEPERADKWRILARLEHLVADRLRTVLVTRDVTIPKAELDLRRGLESAQQYASLTWDETLARLRPELEGYVRDFQAAESRMPADLLSLARFVTAHERALVEFVNLELNREGHRSLEGVLRLLDESPRPQDEAYRSKS